LICVLVGGSYYLFQKRSVDPTPIELPPPPVPPVLSHQPPLVLTNDELDKIKLATMDGDPAVRWAAIGLLYRVGHPQAYEILEKSLKIDGEPSVRRKALDILKKENTPGRVGLLIGALNDTAASIRLAALLALGEIGDPKSIPAIVKALQDTEPVVRRQALSTLGTIQTKQNLDHQKVQNQIRHEYEAALAEHEEKVRILKSPVPGQGLLSPWKAKPRADLSETNKVE